MRHNFSKPRTKRWVCAGLIATFYFSPFATARAVSPQEVQTKAKKVQQGIEDLRDSGASIQTLRPILKYLTQVPDLVSGGKIEEANASLDKALELLDNSKGSQATSAAAHLQYSDLYVNPQLVEISGYTYSAMEPFISLDGKFLFFNNAASVENDTTNTSKRMYYAERTGTFSFRFLGELPGVNTHHGHMDAAAPSIDKYGHFYFTSDREYDKTRHSIFVGDFDGKKVTNIHRVEGDIADTGRFGSLNMDVGISPDGETLYISRAEVDPSRGAPSGCQLLVARRDGDKFNLDPKSEDILKNINSGLEYAPAISDDGLELYTNSWRAPRIWVATRASKDQPFGEPIALKALRGEYLEAPTISLDLKEIFFHKAVDGKCCKIFRAERNPNATK